MMYSNEQKKAFMQVAESLKKYRRAELMDSDSGKDILDQLYVDLLPGDLVLEKCLLDNTTFLVGRRGTGKSTIFLKMEYEYRKKKTHFPCYVDVKTVFESSRAQSINQKYLEEYLEPDELSRYLMSRTFIQNVLEDIYNEIDKQKESFLQRLVNSLTGIDKEEVKSRIKNLKSKVDSNAHFENIEIPLLKQRNISNANSETVTESAMDHCSIKGNASLTDASLDSGVETQVNDSVENKSNQAIEYSDLLLQVFDVKNIIQEIKKILELMKVNKLVIMLDDVSEIDDHALRLFMDTIVSPLNNWSNDFIKFKIAFYPGRVHYGKIDPGKIDIINLDFYDLYSAFDTNKMETNATNFTKRLLENRFGYYSEGIRLYFDDKLNMEDVYSLFFKTSMNVPRIMGYQLSYIYQNVIIYDKKVTKQDIENAAEKYYDNNIAAFFETSTYCLLTLEEQRSIIQLKKIRDIIVEQAKVIKQQIVKGELKGNIYDKKMPYSSHFHVLIDMENYLETLELNHFISKYEEKSNKDGKKVAIYCINYGLAHKNNILWGRANGSAYRKYFIERPFNYTLLVLNQIRASVETKCSKCGRVFSEEEQKFLEFTHNKCPDCGGNVFSKSIIDKDADLRYEESQKLPMLTKEEMDIVLELKRRNESCKARDMAGEVDMDSRRIATICKRLDEDKGLIVRIWDGQVYKYKLSETGKKYGEK